MTTIAAFVDTLRDMTVTDVKRSFEYPPLSLAKGDLPAMWPMLPGSEYLPVSQCTVLNQTHTVIIAIATEAVNQNTQPQKYADILTMADNLNTALTSTKAALDQSWTIEVFAGQPDTPPLFVGGVPYWGVAATVRGNG